MSDGSSDSGGTDSGSSDGEDARGGGSEDDTVGDGAPAPTNCRDPGGAAFGAPGIAPTWSSSDKDFVTTALGGSRLWATVGHGIINEIYWPSTGQPQIRDFGFYLVGEQRLGRSQARARTTGCRRRGRT